MTITEMTKTNQRELKYQCLREKPALNQGMAPSLKCFSRGRNRTQLGCKQASSWLPVPHPGQWDETAVGNTSWGGWGLLLSSNRNRNEQNERGDGAGGRAGPGGQLEGWGGNQLHARGTEEAQSHSVHTRGKTQSLSPLFGCACISSGSIGQCGKL